MFVNLRFPEGPYIKLLGNLAPKYHTIEEIMGPNSLMVVYVDPLGGSRKTWILGVPCPRNDGSKAKRCKICFIPVIRNGVAAKELDLRYNR